MRVITIAMTMLRARILLVPTTAHVLMDMKATEYTAQVVKSVFNICKK